MMGKKKTKIDIIRHLKTLSIPVAIIFCYSLLGLSKNLSLCVPSLVGVTAVITALIALALHMGDKGRVEWSPLTVLTVSAGIRLIFLFDEPSLSDDIYGYLLDGLRLLWGSNPYDISPSFRPESDLMARLAFQVGGSDVNNVHPPGAQLVFAGGAFLNYGVAGIKALLVAMDLGTCVILIKLLPALGMPSQRALAYAWHPLPVIEIAASGQIEAAGVFFLFVALSLLVVSFRGDASGGKKKFAVFLGGFAFSWAILIKLMAFIYLPGCILLAKRRNLLFLLGIAVASSLIVYHFYPEISHMGRSIKIYAASRVHSGFIFLILRTLTGSGLWARWCLGIAFVTISAVFYLRSVTGEENGKGFLDLLFGTFYIISISHLILSPTIQPRQALFMAAFLPFRGEPVGMVYSWSVFLSYRAFIHKKVMGVWMENDITAFMILIAPASALFLSFAQWFYMQYFPREEPWEG